MVAARPVAVETGAVPPLHVLWYRRRSSRTVERGTAAVSTAPGAQATISFTGTSVSWIAAARPGTGIARISLDGIFLTEVDTYSKTEEIRVPMFGATGVATRAIR